MFVPSLLLKKLYTTGSLKNTEQGVQFSIKNRLSDAELVAVRGVAINGTQAPLQSLSLDLGEGRVLSPDHVSADRPLAFPLRAVVVIQAGVEPLPLGKHEIEIAFEARPFGKLKLSVEDAIAAPEEGRVRIPRDPVDDYSDEIVRARQAFVEQFTGVKLQHVSQYSFDPHVAKGNCEHFTGVAQVPLGFAGPIQIDGEHAQGEFLSLTIPSLIVATYGGGTSLPTQRE